MKTKAEKDSLSHPKGGKGESDNSLALRKQGFPLKQESPFLLYQTFKKNTCKFF